MAKRHVTFRVVVFCGVLVLVGLACFANGPKASGISNEMYLGLMERAKVQSESYDFKVLRGAYEKSDFYNPKVNPGEDIPLILEQVDNNVAGAEEFLLNYIGNNFPLPEMHTQLVIWYEKKGDKEKAAYHTWLANGLLNEILKFTDGKSIESPYRVINRGEIKMIMDMKQIPIQATRQWPTPDGHFFEIVKGMGLESGVLEEVWFDLTSTQSENVKAAP